MTDSGRAERDRVAQQRLGAILRQLREQEALTQLDMAAELDRTQSFVTQYERGQRALTVTEAKSIADALGYTLATIVQRWEDPPGTSP